MVIYQGPSYLDPKASIIGVITGLDGRPSKNVKTGPMAQLFILPKDTHPWEAQKTGADSSVCGMCPLRPILGGDCYVHTEHGPAAVFRKFNRNGYEVQTFDHANEALKKKGLSLRLGAYGDPAALPWNVIDRLTCNIRVTGYTHQWRTCDQRFSRVCMASVETLEDKAQAQMKGYRTFRIGDTKETDEFSCPASKEMGKRVTCSDCLLCGGTSSPAKNVVIMKH